MKKLALVLTLAVLMMAFASVAFAAQNLNPANTATVADKVNDYLATDKNFAGYGSQTNYPAGIYLPYVNANGTAGNIHSDYNRNTDACAACHATHTAVGEALLQWDTVQDTCYACHDGTIDETYNVEGGYVAGTAGARTMGGLFGINSTDGVNSLSKHNVEEVSLSAAPGGNIFATAASDAASKQQWTSSFECISCHDPHGNGDNYRILNPNVNGYADTHKILGKAVTAADNKTYNLGVTKILAARGYGVTVYKNGTKITTGFTVDYLNGIVTFNAANLATDAMTFDIAPGLQVGGTVANKLLQTEDAKYGAGMNAFCGACHTDYDTTAVTSPHANLNGTYTDAFRHKVGRTYSVKPGITVGTDSMFTCLTCHVAHGTDEGWWSAWATKSGWAGVVSPEIAGSSALKRLPNMSTCEVCHAKGVNNYNY